MVVEPCFERGATNIFHDETKGPIGKRHQVRRGHDVHVADRRLHSAFLEETGFVERNIRAYGLHGMKAKQAPMPYEVNRSHSSSSQFVQDFVRTYRASRNKVRPTAGSYVQRDATGGLSVALPPPALGLHDGRPQPRGVEIVFGEKVLCPNRHGIRTDALFVQPGKHHDGEDQIQR